MNRKGQVSLRPIQETDLQLLLQFRNDFKFRALCSQRREVIDFEAFRSELCSDFRRDRHQQYIIEINRGEVIPAGTIYSYGLNREDGHCFITVFVVEAFMRRGYGLDAAALLAVFLFESLNLHKIYLEVYDYNQLSTSTAMNFGCVEEGRFKEHRFFDGRRWDLVRFAFYKRDVPKAIVFLERRGYRKVT